MRITFQCQSLRYQEGIRQSFNDLLTASDKVIKERLLLNPESSPSNYVMAYSMQRTLDDMERFTKNAQYADGWLSNTDNAIQGVIDLISQVRNNLALNGNNGYHSSESLMALAGEVLQRYYQLFDFGNTKYQGHYIFGGFQTNTVPFGSKPNNISGLSQIYGAGGEVLARDVFNDLPELKTGDYTVEVTIKGDTGYMTLYDKYGNKMLLDSNGSDESVKGGNSVSETISFKLEPNVVVNTGRGIAVKMPADISAGLKYSFKYESGTTATYYGDNGQIANKIGFNQDVITNITGNQLLLSASKVIKGSQYNTVNGVSLTPSTLFSQITGANSSLGDSIRVSGSDHNGIPVGVAKVQGTAGVNLNMLYASKEERTFTLGYAGKYYQIEVPAKGYKDMDELIYTINGQLATAAYVGSQDLDNYSSSDDMEIKHNFDINAWTTVNSGGQLDLTSQIKAISDGDRLCFVTTDTGNHTSLSVTGFKYNTMGFDDKTVAAFGKDTIFEIGYDFAENGLNTIFTTHANISATGTVSFFINGEYVRINGFNPGNTLEENELLFDNALRQAGFGFTVTAKLTETTPGVYDVTFTMQNVNLDRNTHLATMFHNPLGISDYQCGQVPSNITSWQKEHNVGDFMNFIKSLYDDAVDVSIVDGRLVVSDIRTGASRLTMNITENNQGIGLPIVDQFTKVTGKYEGNKDDHWDLRLNMTHNADGTRTAYIEVWDKNGTKIIDKTVNNYYGQEIELRHGVKLVLDDMSVPSGGSATKIFQLDLKAGAALNFGDMNVASEGDNANAFTSLMNLYNAMQNGFYLWGAGEPSAWHIDSGFNSTAIPYFDDSFFSGNFNALWKYQVEPNGGKTDLYLQKEFTQRLGQLQFINNTVTTLDFTIRLYDNVTQTMTAHSVSVNLTGVTNSAEMTQAIMDAINNNPVLYNEKIHVTIENGQVVFHSGSGAKNISVVPADEKDVYMMGIDNQRINRSLGTVFTAAATFTIHRMDAIAGVWDIPLSVTVPDPLGSYPNGIYPDVNAVLFDIQSQLDLHFGPSVVTAGLVNGVLSFSAAGDPVYYDNVVSPNGALGINNNTQNYIFAEKEVLFDMSEASVMQRMLTFRYLDGITEVSRSIVVDAKFYDNMDDLIAEVNSKLAAEGLNFEAVQYGTKGLAFQEIGADMLISVEGDHEGFLGFPKTGDKITIAVTDEKGRSIQNVIVDTANVEYSVSDGLLFGFDKGSLIATDSFTGTIGSGITYELGILDLVESQLLQCLTLTGNRQARVESVIEFNATFKTVGENQKAVYMGSTDIDKIDAATQLSMAENAYKYALSITAQIMSISILDYLR
jgi:flagellin-like hook-associated protein FlgL